MLSTSNQDSALLLSGDDASTVSTNATTTSSGRGACSARRRCCATVVICATALLLFGGTIHNIKSIQQPFAAVKSNEMNRRTTKSDDAVNVVNSTATCTWEPALRMLPLPQPFRPIGGGIVFFLHIPKTGGTTMRAFLQKHADELHVARNSHGWQGMIQQMDEAVVNGTDGKLIAFETHDQNVPSYRQLSPRLREWRRIANENNVPFFMATLLRESVSIQISSFNYYYVAPWKKLANVTVQDFHDTLLYNPQCSFLHEGGMFFGDLDRKHPELRDTRNRLNAALRKEHCDAVYMTLLEDMDWVGTTERIKSETLPLFHYLFQHTNITGKGHVNNMKARMKRERLNESDVALVRNTTLWDQQWYNTTREIYRFDEWRQQIGPEFFFPNTR